MKDKIKNLVIVAGPTASGKTALAIQLAIYFNTEIISADSRQFYKELNIGTAKPRIDELNQAVHHFIGHISVHQEYNAGRFETDALALIEEKFKMYDYLILVGGSGMFTKAVCEGLDEMPLMDPRIRIQLNEKFKNEGLDPLLSQLYDLDENYYNLVDKNNPQRIIRALEVCLSTGKPFSSFRTGKKALRNFNIIKIGLHLPRKELYERINARVESMMDSGLLDEARQLTSCKKLNALQTVGYAELFEYFDNKVSLEKAVDLIKQNSRHYAKRQLTWFLKDKDIHWFDPGQFKEIITYISGNTIL